jgi:hypothetical protein
MFKTRLLLGSAAAFALASAAFAAGESTPLASLAAFAPS